MKKFGYILLFLNFISGEDYEMDDSYHDRVWITIPQITDRLRRK